MRIQYEAEHGKSTSGGSASDSGESNTSPNMPNPRAKYKHPKVFQRLQGGNMSLGHMSSKKLHELTPGAEQSAIELDGGSSMYSGSSTGRRVAPRHIENVGKLGGNGPGSGRDDRIRDFPGSRGDVTAAAVAPAAAEEEESDSDSDSGSASASASGMATPRSGIYSAGIPKQLLSLTDTGCRRSAPRTIENVGKMGGNGLGYKYRYHVH